MTLDEAIVHEREVATMNFRLANFYPEDIGDNGIQTDCLECAREHEQLAEWLEELKMRREREKYGTNK